jgi:AcrR family transcriptional regulator
MTRPSQKLDEALLDSGMVLLPLYGCKSLAVRQLAEHAGVNLGMFHYHFKSKEVFIRAVLQRMYEAMFVELMQQVTRTDSALENLSNALQVLAKFTRLNSALLSRLLADAIDGEHIAIEFLRASLPRHAQVVADLVTEAQKEGAVVTAPVPSIVAFLAGAVGAPIVLGGAVARITGQGNQSMATQALALIEHHVLSDEAIAQRVGFALRGISALHQE